MSSVWVRVVVGVVAGIGVGVGVGVRVGVMVGLGKRLCTTGERTTRRLRLECFWESEQIGDSD